MSVFYAVEDQLSGSVAKRLIRERFGLDFPLMELGKKAAGFGYLKTNLSKYASLAMRSLCARLDRLGYESLCANTKSRMAKGCKATKSLTGQIGLLCRCERSRGLAHI